MNTITLSTTQCALDSILRIQEIEKECYIRNNLTISTFTKLTTCYRELNFFLNELKINVPNKLISNVNALVPLPSTLNDFTKIAYLGLLKKKYDKGRIKIHWKTLIN